MNRKPRLRVLSEQLRGTEFELEGERLMVGRAPDADICIRDSSVSGIHCELVLGPNGEYQVVDDGQSTNGTRICGMLVTRETLHDGDVLQIGMVECMYENPQGQSTPSSTQAQIEIEPEGIEANHLHGAGPKWDREQGKSRAPVVIKVVITGLTLIVLTLSAILAWHIYIHIG